MLIRNILGIGIVFVALLPRILPFLYHSHPLGYDTGFYRRYILQDAGSFFHQSVPGLGNDALLPRLFLDSLRLIGIPPDIILYGSYLLLSMLSLGLIFLLVAHYEGRATGFFAAFLFALSPIQYTAYWYMFYKQAFALPLLLITFLLLEKKSPWATLSAIGITLSHQTTSIIFFATTIPYIVTSPRRLKQLAAVFIPAAVLFGYLHGSWYTNSPALPVGVFMEIKEYLMLSFPMLVFAAIGISSFFARQKYTVMSMFLGITAIFPILLLPFYQRTFFFLDAALALPASMGAVILWQQFRSASKNYMQTLMAGLLIGLFTWQAYFLWRTVVRLAPLVSREELRELETIDRLTLPHATILTSTALAPWVQGWSIRQVEAPGMFGDTRDVHEWRAFGQTTNAQEKIKFLTTFPAPLFFFLPPSEQTPFLTWKECIRRQSDYLLYYTC